MFSDNTQESHEMGVISPKKILLGIRSFRKLLGSLREQLEELGFQLGSIDKLYRCKNE
jgi:hypothetical protein